MGGREDISTLDAKKQKIYTGDLLLLTTRLEDLIYYRTPLKAVEDTMQIPKELEFKSDKAKKVFARKVLDLSKEAMDRCKNKEMFFWRKMDEQLNQGKLTKVEAIWELFAIRPDQPWKTINLIGGRMENTVETLGITIEKVKENKEALQTLYNELIAVDNEISPLLVAQIEKIRDVRMTVDREVHGTIKNLREIKTFFNDNEKEITKLKEFISLCEQFNKLKNDGIIDAILSLKKE